MTTATQTWGGNTGRGTVVFRCDASLAIGTGHVMRCLTLAGELSGSGIRCVFVCRECEGDMRAEIRRHGFEVATLPAFAVESIDGNPWLGVSFEQDAQQTIRALIEIDSVPDWLVVDHYGIDSQWEQMLRSYVGNILVIDDLANRSHECRMILDQNLYDNLSTRYSQLVPESCSCLLGPRYALLRDEFRRARERGSNRSGQINKVLLFFGGIDLANLTLRSLRALSLVADLHLKVDVVVGSSNPHADDIRREAESNRNVMLHFQTNEMAALMQQADLSIGAGGTTTWERAFLGLPSIAVVVAENQRAMTDAAARAGACINLGWHEQVTASDLASAIRDAHISPQRMRKMSKLAQSLSAPDHQLGTAEVARRMMQRMKVMA